MDAVKLIDDEKIELTREVKVILSKTNLIKRKEVLEKEILKIDEFLKNFVKDEKENI